ncbi:hypothetical protein [Nocardioides baculatus]|uniref:Uncharacterized protein n=1 Tax=Nocardioides baculatus TaxID=2801337 RepID=A0ABS1L7K4_9ACTN|nr:hypothetical protein [Nocardioides baculatus]MBL0746526.1 hypothetical protein [Nocardioides baculatus]
MFQYVLYDEPSFDDDIPESPTTPPWARTSTEDVADAAVVHLGGCADTDSPLYTLLCSELGVPVADWSGATVTSAPGRHVACVLDATTTVAVPLDVTDRSVALLERTLAALHVWEPSA